MVEKGSIIVSAEAPSPPKIRNLLRFWNGRINCPDSLVTIMFLCRLSCPSLSLNMDSFSDLSRSYSHLFLYCLALFCFWKVRADRLPLIEQGWQPLGYRGSMGWKEPVLVLVWMTLKRSVAWRLVAFTAQIEGGQQCSSGGMLMCTNTLKKVPP